MNLLMLGLAIVSVVVSGLGLYFEIGREEPKTQVIVAPLMYIPGYFHETGREKPKALVQRVEREQRLVFGQNLSDQVEKKRIKREQRPGSRQNLSGQMGRKRIKREQRPGSARDRKYSSIQKQETACNQFDFAKPLCLEKLAAAVQNPDNFIDLEAMEACGFLERINRPLCISKVFAGELSRVHIEHCVENYSEHSVIERKICLLNVRRYELLTRCKAYDLQNREYCERNIAINDFMDFDLEIISACSNMKAVNQIYCIQTAHELDLKPQKIKTCAAAENVNAKWQRLCLTENQRELLSDKTPGIMQSLLERFGADKVKARGWDDPAEAAACSSYFLDSDLQEICLDRLQAGQLTLNYLRVCRVLQRKSAQSVCLKEADALLLNEQTIMACSGSNWYEMVCIKEAHRLNVDPQTVYDCGRLPGDSYSHVECVKASVIKQGGVPGEEAVDEDLRKKFSASMEKMVISCKALHDLVAQGLCLEKLSVVKPGFSPPDPKVVAACGRLSLASQELCVNRVFANIIISEEYIWKCVEESLPYLQNDCLKDSTAKPSLNDF